MIKIFTSMTSQALDPPSVTNCHTFSDPLPLERDVLYGWPPYIYAQTEVEA